MLDVLDGIQRFIEALRKEGARISTAESIDAMTAIRSVGVENRPHFRAALKATLTKTKETGDRFDRTFDAHFQAPHPGSRKERGRKHGPRKGAGAGTARRGSPPDAASSARRSARADRLRKRRHRVASVRRRTGRLRFVLSERVDPPASPARRSPANRARGIRPVPPPAARAAAPRGMALSRRDWSRGPDHETDAGLLRCIPVLIRKIKIRVSRRHRARARGRPWPARLMRRSLHTGGVPFVLPARRRRETTARVLVLADVSWSVLRVSGFFLDLASALIRVGRDVRVVLFVDRCADVTRTLLRRRGGEPLRLERVMEAREDLDPGAPSDYGRAFHQAASPRSGLARGLGRNAVLVVLGDARNNGRDPQEWELERLSEKFRKVIWIHPEPEILWGTGDSDIERYLPSCDVICEARDLDGLARGVSEIVRSL